MIRSILGSRDVVLAVTALVFAVCWPAGASAQQSNSDLNQAFSDWIIAEIWPEAKGAGVSRTTFDAAFDEIAPNLTLPDLRLPGAGDDPPIVQAEFRRPGAYFDEAGLASLTRIGRDEL